MAKAESAHPKTCSKTVAVFLWNVLLGIAIHWQAGFVTVELIANVEQRGIARRFLVTPLYKAQATERVFILFHAFPAGPIADDWPG